MPRTMFHEYDDMDDMDDVDDVDDDDYDCDFECNLPAMLYK